MKPDYKRLHGALDALPPGMRRLAKDYVWSAADGCGCALGTALPPELWPWRNSLSFASILAGDANKQVEGLRAYGLTVDTIREIERTNDNFKGTPEERFEYMLAWFKKKLEERDET